MPKYIPEVNDYVIWDKGEYGKDEGWVYFDTGELADNINKNRQARYITIETGIRERPVCETEEQLGNKIKHSKHKFIHTLLLCYEQYWHELVYIHSRPDCKSKEYFNRFNSPL